MFDHQPALRRGAAAVLTCAALLGAGTASAKIFTTSASVQDFRFDQDRVLYTTPSLDQVSWELTESNQIVMTSIDEAELRTGLGNDGEVVGTLNLGGGMGPDGYQGQYEYTMFGSLPPAEQTSIVELVSGALDAMQSAPNEQSLAFLFSGGPATGSAGTLYQSVGIFAVVYGISDMDWLAQYVRGGGQSPLAFTTASVDGPDNLPAAPLPATPLLLLAGLLGLRLAQRRR
jgi:hypothetical protein